LYDRLFRVPDPASFADDFTNYLNPGSLESLFLCQVEPSLALALPGGSYQFERLGYFCADLKDSVTGKLVFNRIVPLRDSWGKIAGQGKE
jgi:glutaminyl-tRNA synthetase